MLLYSNKLNIIFIFLLGLICNLVVFTGCKKSQKTDEISSKIKNEIIHYFHPQIVDSIQIKSIDTVSSLGYAVLAADILQKIKWEVEQEYQQALLQNSDTLSGQWETDLSELDYYLHFFEEKKANENTPANNVLLFWVSGCYYYQGKSDYFEILLHPDYSVYELDVFNDNLLE